MIKIFIREETISSMPTVWAPRFYTWGLKDVKNKKGLKIGPRERPADFLKFFFSRFSFIGYNYHQVRYLS